MVGQIEAHPGAAMPSKQHVLVVDDEVDILESLKDLFEALLENVQVWTATGGAAGLRILAEQPIDLVISDYKMPGMNGLEFLGKARAAAPDVPRILATAFPDAEIAIRAAEETHTATFITKPFEPEEAVRAVEDMLAARRASAEAAGRGDAGS